MNNKITTEDLINQLPKEVAEQVRKEVAEEVEKIRLNEKRNNKCLQH